MGKAKRRNLEHKVKDKFQYMTRENALDMVVKNIENKSGVIDTITLFGFSAEEMLEAGVPFEDVCALGGLVK